MAPVMPEEATATVPASGRDNGVGGHLQRRRGGVLLAGDGHGQDHPK